MDNRVLGKYGIKQLGYYVESIEDAAQRFRSLLGAGPFVDLGVSEPAELVYRGNASGMRSRCALGHLGEMQIELIEVVTGEPDVYKELGGYGLHHVCIWSDDVDAVKADMSAAGIEAAMEMTSGQGLKVVYFDAREQLGSFVEVNAPIEQLWQGIKAVHEKSPAEAPSLMPMSALMG